MQEIIDALQWYFDGWYECNPEKLRAVFHPASHLFCVINGALDDDGMEKVYAYVSARPSPVSRNEARHDRVLSIDITGSQAALAKVQLAIGEKLFTDYLTLLRISGRWQIVSKAFCYVPLAQK